MRATPVVLTIFPLTLVGMMASERIALLALGANPESPMAWNFWLHLHGTSGRMWLALETRFGGFVPAHLLGLVLVAAIIVLALKSRRWPAYSFLINHAALIAAVAASLLSSQPRVSSLSPDFPRPGDWAVSWVSQFSSIQLLLIICGVASCLLCHTAFWLNARMRHAPVSLHIRMLRQNL